MQLREKKIGPPQDGVRERKRRATSMRITETALRLFLTDGYEATTLDAIAIAAGISRRTFFSYFKSKEEILLAWQSGSIEAFRDALLKQSVQQRPIDAVENALVTLITAFESDEFLAIDRLMRSTETLRTRKIAVYERQEEALFSALCQLWPKPSRGPALRLVAMASIGALRLAFEQWRAAGSRRSIGGYLRKNFSQLRAELASSAESQVARRSRAGHTRSRS